MFVPKKPYTPEHKGKVESAVKYAKNNALEGYTLRSLTEQNEHLLHWEETVADTRIAANGMALHFQQTTFVIIKQHAFPTELL